MAIKRPGRVKAAFAERTNRIYLNCTLLQPGDILLTRSAGPISGITALSTKGPYSHASLIVNNMLLIESTGVGVGYGVLRRDRIEVDHASGDRELFKFHDTVKKAKVFRKADLKSRLGGAGLFELLNKSTSKYLGREYSKLARLANTLDPKSALGRLAMAALPLADRIRRHEKVIPGPFCSELVAAIYSDIGCALFPEARSSSISPNSFLRLGLEVVEGACVQENPDPSLDEANAAKINEVLDLQARLLNVEIRVGVNVKLEEINNELTRRERERKGLVAGKRRWKPSKEVEKNWNDLLKQVAHSDKGK